MSGSPERPVGDGFGAALLFLPVLRPRRGPPPHIEDATRGAARVGLGEIMISRRTWRRERSPRGLPAARAKPRPAAQALPGMIDDPASRALLTAPRRFAPRSLRAAGKPFLAVAARRSCADRTGLNTRREHNHAERRAATTRALPRTCSIWNAPKDLHEPQPNPARDQSPSP